MIGAFTIGKKAVKFGYKRFGIPGAVASGGAALAGYVVVRRALKSSVDSDGVDSAINAETIKTAVDEKGLDAVTDEATLNDAIDEERVDSSVDMDDVQSSAEEETDELADDRDSDRDGSDGGI